MSASQFSLPYSLALDSSNAIYVADRYNNRIQKWIIGGSSGTTVAGQANGASGSALNYLNGPCDVLVDSIGTLYVSDTENHRVLSYASGTTVGTILAGTGTYRRWLQMCGIRTTVVDSNLSDLNTNTLNRNS